MNRRDLIKYLSVTPILLSIPSVLAKQEDPEGDFERRLQAGEVIKNESFVFPN